ncbi:MAG: phosphate acyltransferase, partial [Clostridia bacterium]|nr:phosphate acyltransferase [Clostridia bacterium]
TTPKVALLSVGKEQGKGTALQKEAYDLLNQLPIDFIGNMEGSDLVKGYADVVVADGFSGNILLKSVEAAGLTARGMVEAIAAKNGEGQSAMVEEMLERLAETFDLNPRGGATFLGTKKTVIKMHGCAVEQTPIACIDQLLRLEASGFSSKIAESLSQMM